MQGRLCWFIPLAVITYAQHPCFRWELKAGIALRFNVEANDTIAIGGEPQLFRHRIEEWIITCDSTRGDTLFLRQSLKQYWAREWNNHGDSSTRQTIPHVGTTAYIVLTQRGWRVSAQSMPTQAVSVVPGSVFGPVFFVPLDSHCARCGGTQWLVEQRDTLVEYASPPATMDRLYLCSIDSCTEEGIPRILSFAETSRGFHVVHTDSLAINTSVWMLSHGVIELNTAAGLPKRLSYANQQRILVEHPALNRSRRGTVRSALSATVEILVPRYR